MGLCIALCRAQGGLYFWRGCVVVLHGCPSAEKKSSIKDRTLTYEHTLNFKLTISTLPIVFFGRLSSEQTMANANCYYPDGSIATADTPCNSAANGTSVSPCCANSNICVDNALCLTPCLTVNRLPIIYRGSCTDKTWKSPECAQYCSDGNCHLFSKALDLIQKTCALSLVSSR